MTSFLYNAGQSTFDSFFPIVISRTVGMGPTMIGAVDVFEFGLLKHIYSPLRTNIQVFRIDKNLRHRISIRCNRFGDDWHLDDSVHYRPRCVLFRVLGVPLFTPSIPILLMQCVPTTSRGAVMGFDSAINSSARIITPVLLGSVFAASRGEGVSFCGGMRWRGFRYCRHEKFIGI